MAYRSLKRVLSETSLERKCRLLFGSCLLLLIAGAFVWVDKIAEDLVDESKKKVLESARQQGETFIDLSMLKLHFLHFEKSADPPKDEHEKKLRDSRYRFLNKVIQSFDNQEYQVEILAYDKSSSYNKAATPWEREILESLEKQLKAKRAEQASRGAPPTEKVAAKGAEGAAEVARGKQGESSGGEAEQAASDPTGLKALDDPALFSKRLLPPVYQHRLLDDKNEYHYYQAIYFKDKCLFCHPKQVAVGAISAAEGSVVEEEPFRVVKVVLPIERRATAINKIRAILIAAGLTTFFVAMIALYVIVRYVIVKPLSHLRDISDNISRGKTELRAEINTSDEFEELADSFNRMLRHLTDTQADLREANRGMDAKVDELAQLNMRLYEMNRLKDDFMANMSHELRTPLNSIIGFSEVLQEIDSLSGKQKRYAQNIQKSGRLLLEMINDILDLAKVEAGKMELRPTEFRVDTLISAQCDMVRSLTDEKNIELTVAAPADEQLIYQDQAKVQQILTNLLSNAIKFTPEGGRIAVSAIRADRRLALTVQDTGVGIAEEDRDVIFEKFRQSEIVVGEDGLTREYSGTGLGLSIVKELCKLMGGEITVSSELGIGSTFKVTLPWELANTPRADTRLNERLQDLTLPSGELHAPLAEEPVSQD